MACNGSVVAKFFILHRRCAGADRVKETHLVIHYITIMRRRHIGLGLFNLEDRRLGLRMVRMPLCQILVAKFDRPANSRISLRRSAAS